MVRFRRGLAAIALGGLIAAGCGIPTQQEPSAIPPDRVPLGLASGTLPTTATTQPDAKSEAEVTIYLLQLPDEGLVARTRFVQIPAPLKSILTALLAGPEVSEAADGIITAIPTNVQLIGVTPGPVVTVNFNTAFGEITGSDTELAVAQVVATVAAQNGYKTGVSFEVDGVPISVPIASGAQVPGPVYILQFLKPAT